MSAEIPREMKIAADALAARDHLDDPAWATHELVAAQIWRTFKALGNQGGHVLTIGDNCATLLGLPRGTGPRHGSVISNVDRHDNAIGPLSDINHGDEHEDFDVVIAALAGFDVRLTYAPNIIKRRSDHLVDTVLAVSVTKPGGLAAVIATHDLMDNPMPFGRRQIGDLADLVGAVRFPAGAYRRATGTDEIADLLVFRRREPGAPRRGAEWEEATAVHLDDGIVFINTYIDANFDQVLGSTQYDPTGRPPTNLTVVGNRTLLPGLLTNALNNVIAFGQRAKLTVPNETANDLQRGFATRRQSRAAREKAAPSHPAEPQRAPRPDSGRGLW